MLAGKTKLRSFLLILAAAGGLASFGLYQACSSKKDGDPVASAPPPTPSPSPSRSDVRPPDPPTPVAPVDRTPVANPIGESGADLPARPYDREILAWQGKSISGDKIKDAAKGRSWKVNVYKDAGKATVNRAKVDLDRDDKFDEKYTFDEGKVTLQRAPADDEQYTETFHWTGDGWASEK